MIHVDYTYPDTRDKYKSVTRDFEKLTLLTELIEAKCVAIVMYGFGPSFTRRQTAFVRRVDKLRKKLCDDILKK